MEREAVRWEWNEGTESQRNRETNDGKVGKVGGGKEKLV